MRKNIFTAKRRRMQRKRNMKVFVGAFFCLMMSLLITSPYKENINNEVMLASSENSEIKSVKSDNVKSTSDKKIDENELNTSNLRASRSGDFSDERRDKENEEIIKEEKMDENSDLSKEVKGIAITSEKTIVKPSKVEKLDWFKEAQFVYPIGAVAEIEDIYTGKTFKVKRTFGDNHADVEALTKDDTKVIKEIWGGFSWERRPVIVSVSGRRIAASLAAMPHAGNDAYPALSEAPNLSGGYGTGQNLDVVKGNEMDGVCDLHFLNSMRHNDGEIMAAVDDAHQSCIEIAAKSK